MGEDIEKKKKKKTKPWKMDSAMEPGRPLGGMFLFKSHWDQGLSLDQVQKV